MEKKFTENEQRLFNSLSEVMKTMNSVKLKESIENIDKKLDILIENMDYIDYLEFIKSNNNLKQYDDMLGKFQNKIIYTEEIVNNLPEEFLKEVDKYISDKIKELNLEYIDKD